MSTQREPTANLEELVAECIVALDAGEPEAVERIVAAHPELSDAIRDRLEVLGHAGLMRHREPVRPDRIGEYHVLATLGEGGMGTVYRAEQREPVRRQVAIKVIKLGMDSKEVLARFELERRALAAMNHTNIAKVLAAGTTEKGQPYFVMELVAGLPITAYCDKHRLSVKDRIALFRQVCAGVQHAHQKGVMHRDLKPANILVEREDDRALPKIVDFGLAKAMNRELMAQSIFTQHAVVVGTPEYMAPEQAAPDEETVDTRADIYSLGVLLYELLTGVLPFSSLQLRRGAWAELQRVLTEVEPPKPSTQICRRESGDTDRARRRRTELRALERQLRGDLDWIVLKAMAKEPERRYESANGLAADLARYLDHEPVSAGPPTAGYRIRKLVRRYRGQAVAAAIVLVALLLGVVGTSIGFKQARDNEALAVERADALDDALEDARRRSEELQQVVEFQEKQLEVIDVARMADGLRRGAIAEASASIRRRESGDADAAIAAFVETLGGVNFTNLALDALQTQLFERAVEAIDEQFSEQPVVAAGLLRATGNAQRALGILVPATTSLRRVLEIRERELGEEDWDTIVSTGELGEILMDRSLFAEADPYVVRAHENARRCLGADHPDTIAALNSVAQLRRHQGRIDESVTLFREALAATRREFGEDASETLTALANFGAILGEQGQYEEAETLVLAAIDGRRRVFGDDDPKIPNLQNSLGAFYVLRERVRDGEPYLRAAVESARRLWGDAHPDTLTYMNSLGCALAQDGRLDEAEPILWEALERCREALGEHRLTYRLWDSLGSWHLMAEELRDAVDCFETALAGRRRLLDPGHPDTLETAGKLGALFVVTGRHDEAESLLREALEGWESLPNDNTIRPLEAAMYYSVLQRVRRNHAEAEKYARRALADARRIFGDDSEMTKVLAQTLAVSLGFEADSAIEARDFSRAEELFLEAHALMEESYEPGHANIAACVQRIVKLYELWHAAEPDRGHDAEAARWRERLD